MAWTKPRSRLIAAVFVMCLAAAMSGAALAKRPDNPGGGNGGGGNDVCTDAFPSFAFKRVANNKRSSDAFYLASSEGCRVVKIADLAPWGSGPAFSYNNGRGLIVWKESSGDLSLMRFSVAPDGVISIDTEPQLVLSPEPLVESFRDFDVWTDYSADEPEEYVSLRTFYDYRKLEPPGTGADFEIKVVNVSECTISSCAADTLISVNSDFSLTCMGPGPFDPVVQSECLVPDGKPAFNDTGDKIYYLTRTVVTTGEQHRGTARLIRPDGGWLAGAPMRELVAISNAWDCVADAMPYGGRAAQLLGKEVLVATACIGFAKGKRDQRLFFLDADTCVANPASGWRACEEHSLLTGEISSRHASWRRNGEVLYDSWTPGSIRAFQPDLTQSTNNRELISKGRSSDSGL